ncbi:hypothetical protein NC652_000166 [Populus alba x Populus x berolinensis]|nr:hypothetical protein NC652_000166 [Populus alba x Populus x berolinensis]
MGFVSEKEEENQSLSMGRNTQASLMGGSWWWQNVKAFVNGGSAALLTQLQFLLVESAIYYYLRSWEKESAAKAFKQLPHLQNLKKRQVHIPLELPSCYGIRIIRASD